MTPDTIIMFPQLQSPHYAPTSQPRPWRTSKPAICPNKIRHMLQQSTKSTICPNNPQNLPYAQHCSRAFPHVRLVVRTPFPTGLSYDQTITIRFIRTLQHPMEGKKRHDAQITKCPSDVLRPEFRVVGAGIWRPSSIVWLRVVCFRVL